MIEVVPISQREAKAYIAENHRHHKAPAGSIINIAVSDGAEIRGVLMAGRPVSRMLDDGWTLEVNRCCTDGVNNGCSMLYRAAWRAAKAMGWRKLITYTLPEEGGASMRGAGMRLVGERGGGKWSRNARPRVDDHPQQSKLLWELSTPPPTVKQETG